MISKFGKITRKIRVDKEEILGDMAANIGVSVAFLSKIENGLAKPSRKVVEAIINKYGLTGKEKEELEDAAMEFKNGYLIDFSKLSAKEKRYTVQFAKALPKMPEEDLHTIRNIIDLYND